jgi:hypothetical protein
MNKTYYKLRLRNARLQNPKICKKQKYRKCSKKTKMFKKNENVQKKRKCSKKTKNVQKKRKCSKKTKQKRSHTCCAAETLDGFQSHHASPDAASGADNEAVAVRMARTASRRRTTFGERTRVSVPAVALT